MTKKNKMALDRRTVLATGAAALATPMLGRRANAQVSELTVADPGGPFTQGYRKAFYDPFAEETGIEIVSVARDAEPTAQFKSIVETGTYIWDVCTLTLSARLILENEDLLDPLNLDPALTGDMMPEAVHPNFLGIDVYSTVFGYNTEAVQKPPSNWAEYWDVENFPGRRALRKNPIDTLEQALMADGVAPEDLYPLDVDRAFAKLDEIKDDIAVWWTGGAQTSQLLQSGEVDMTSGWNARLQAAIDSGAPAKIVWNQGLYSIEGWGLPKGGPKGDAAREFVAFCSRPEQQALFTDDLSYGPTNLKAYDYIDAERAKVLTTAPENLAGMRIADEAWWEENRAEMTERFNIWLLT
ncbi:ABC transporter substrate-binding protein [Roseovarius spongiae]|uniref:ABC transporter substrate-binding protein n=1 Tax=Roseovarius spongiae TaxID=2320272 RepID=A0A3A8AU41_9RHOB|nr:ABC transporter substrate-binding protein [Roseovarius spongiae]RKF14150.1 ABC transporter substrate-binding protein [Roseovarius spongiae]